MPKVSIIVPVYNAEKYLSRCLESLVEQTLKDIEIIAINDGSTDNSLSILERFESYYKDKFKVIDKFNEGAGSARNRGLDIATGEFIKFVDADDYLNLNILDKMYKMAKEYNVSLVRGNYQTVLGPIRFGDISNWGEKSEAQIIDVREDKDYVITETPAIGNKLISRELLGDLKFPEKTKWEDLAIIPVVIASSEKLLHMNEPVYNYRINMNTTIKDFIYAIPNVIDIINSLNYLKTEMKKRQLDEEYQNQIESLYILHTLYRVENALNWVNFPEKKKIVVIQSLINILDLEYPNWKENPIIEKYKRINPIFKLNMSRLDFYMSDYCPNTNFEQIQLNIKRLFKS